MNRSAATERLAGRAEDGAVIVVVVPGHLLGTVEDFWPARGLERLAETPSGADRVVSLRSSLGGTLEVEVDGAAGIGGWHRVESELSLFAAERLVGLVAVHAAGIASGGRVLMVPGFSGVGKSRLCLAAATAGATVLTDEFVLVDPRDGTVTGLHRPIRIRTASGGIDRHDLAQPTAPLPVGLVALVSFTGQQPPSIEEIPSARAVLGLLDNTICAQSRPDDAMDAALAVAKSCPAVAGTRGEAATALQELLDRMGS